MERILKLRSKTEDGRRSEFILNIVLICSILMLCVIEVIVIYHSLRFTDSGDGIGILKMSFVLAIFIFLYYLSRKGQIRIASYCLVSIYFTAASAGSYYLGVTLPSILLTYALIITIASVLITSRFGFALSLLTILSLLIIGRREITSENIVLWKDHPLVYGDIITYGILLLMITVISWLSNRETEKSLNRARKSEEELIIERDSLEIKVERRTRELKKAQIEKITQLSKFAEFGKLSSGLFHDLMSPLSSISLNIHDVENDIHPDLKGVKDQLANAVKASKRMETFLSSIRKQIRMEEYSDIFCLNDIIEEAISLFSHKAIRAKVEIIFEAQNKISTHGNPIKFHQIISNLVANAIDAHENKPELINKIIRIKLVKNIDRAQIEIMDNGPGIEPKILPKIFDQFFTTKPQDKGTGMGLYITKEIVETDFKGTIIVTTSNKPKSTVFTVTIPLENSVNDIS